MMNPRAYTSRLPEPGIESETIGEALQKKLNAAILTVVEGREGEAERAVALEAVEYLRRKKVDGIITGCTEIPLLLGKNMDAADMLNPSQILAEAAIRFAIS